MTVQTDPKNVSFMWRTVWPARCQWQNKGWQGRPNEKKELPPKDPLSNRADGVARRCQWQRKACRGEP